VEVEEAHLPSERERTSAVWIRNHAYVFGGQENAIYHDDIMRFGPRDITETQIQDPILLYQLMGLVGIMVIIVWIVGRRKKTTSE
jgi:hypothetical protein